MMRSAALTMHVSSSITTTPPEPSMLFKALALYGLAWRTLARIGRREEAREAFEALLARRNKMGLLSEDLDPVTGELWGNFPQTYSMVGIINGAVRLSAPWDSAV